MGDFKPLLVAAVAPKGLGVLAAVDTQPGTVLAEDRPLLLLDPPSSRRDLLLLLGAKRFSRLTEPAASGNSATLGGSSALGCARSSGRLGSLAAPGPEVIRARVLKAVLEAEVAKMSDGERAAFFSLSDRRAEVSGEPKTLWGVWETNCVPTDSYR